MKYLVFNIVVAAALVFLAIGGDMKWPGSDKDNPTADATPQISTDDLLTRLKPAIEETAAIVAEQVAQEIAEQTRADLQAQMDQMAQPAKEPVAATTPEIQTSPTVTEVAPVAEADEVSDIPPLPEIAVETPAVHRPMDEVPAGAVAQAPAVPSQPDAHVQLAEGEQMMSPRDRQRELDALVQNMELMFVEKAGQ